MLLKNISKLVQVREPGLKCVKGREMRELPCIDNAWLLLEDGRIKDFGPMATCPEGTGEILDVSGRMVFPCWVDSHTHLVFAGSRETEFADRIGGLTYEEIAAKGGGILNSARRLQETPEETLLEDAYARLQEVRDFGTGAIEIKSGYGLTVESELKMLRVIRKLDRMTDMTIKATFLGAHAFPVIYRENREAYLHQIIHEMLPRITGEGLADYIDVFCEKKFFQVDEAIRIMEAGLQYGLKAKIHTNQFYSIGGIQAAIRCGAVSVDHLEIVTETDMEALLHSDTIPTLLPSAPFFLNDHYPPARRMMDMGLPVALATDYNPGTTPSGRMSFVLSLACIKLKMTPEEAINAATINGAFALELSDQLGSITRGKIANVFITKPIPSIAYLPYAFGSDLVEQVILRGNC